MANLLLNAVRYTPADGTVRIDAGREDDARLAVGCRHLRRHSPRPTCPGCSTSRSGASRPVRPAPAAGGASGGLGLAIVRGLVEAHGGRVEVRNTPDGCQFMVRLGYPLRPRSAALSVSFSHTVRRAYPSSPRPVDGSQQSIILDGRSTSRVHTVCRI